MDETSVLCVQDFSKNLAVNIQLLWNILIIHGFIKFYSWCLGSIVEITLCLKVLMTP